MTPSSLAMTPRLRRQLADWLQEDLGRGDLTAPALQGRTGQAHWIAKAPGLFCGGVLVRPLLAELMPEGDGGAEVRLLVADGQSVAAGERLLELSGPAQALVALERTALNLAMGLSGIATATAALVAELKGTGVRLADTRKTTPGLRELEKYAVRCGGGINHRMGLDDAAMLKENHLAWGGGVEAAVQVVRQSAPWPAAVIVEAETPAQADQAVRAGADGLLLDEFSAAQLQELVPQLRHLARDCGAGRLVLEASGVDPEQLRAYAATGVDLISTSAPVTRSRWLDLSMRFSDSGLI
ncbi:MAG: carboxylating nicotinate-nucleotide diphosphorylase [Prochlorococcus sp.]|nr:carboxylating nicotinate-nucleotide diphosphorylase [Prochlorococcaceae cyanobacterium Fu_MAG_50]